MGLEEIKKALGENSSLVDEVSSLYENNTSNVARIGTLESELTDAVGRRKKLHELVSKATGLTELSEENLLKFASNADEGLKADNETLQSKLQELTELNNGLASKHEGEISEMILKDTLRGLGVSDRVQNDRAFQELTKLVLTGAERNGATFTFKEDGKTIFGEAGKPLNVEDRVIQLQQSEFSYLFKQSQGGGGGQTPPPNQQHQTKLESAVTSTIASMGKF